MEIRCHGNVPSPSPDRVVPLKLFCVGFETSRKYVHTVVHTQTHAHTDRGTRTDAHQQGMAVLLCSLAYESYVDHISLILSSLMARCVNLPYMYNKLHSNTNTETYRHTDTHTHTQTHTRKPPPPAYAGILIHFTDTPLSHDSA